MGVEVGLGRRSVGVVGLPCRRVVVLFEVMLAASSARS
jgi:hypothetical protein